MNFNEVIHRIIAVGLTFSGFIVATLGPIVVVLRGDPGISSNALLMKILAFVGTVVAVCGAIQIALKYWADTQLQITRLKLGHVEDK